MLISYENFLKKVGMTTVEQYKESVLEYLSTVTGSKENKFAVEEMKYLGESLEVEGWSSKQVAALFNTIKSVFSEKSS